MGGGVWARCVRFVKSGSRRRGEASVWIRRAGMLGISGILRVPGVALESENAIAGIFWNSGILMRPRYRYIDVRPGLSLS